MTDRKKQSTVNCNSPAILPMVNCPKAIRISLSLTQCNVYLNSLCNCVTLKLRCLEIRYFLFLSNLNICQSQKQKQKWCPYKIQFLICIMNTSNWQLAIGCRSTGRNIQTQSCVFIILSTLVQENAWKGEQSIFFSVHLFTRIFTWLQI